MKLKIILEKIQLRKKLEGRFFLKKKKQRRKWVPPSLI